MGGTGDPHELYDVTVALPVKSQISTFWGTLTSRLNPKLKNKSRLKYGPGVKLEPVAERRAEDYRANGGGYYVDG
ncbi:hypothetical protein RUM43_008182 [Polyplax serrata]|uniref:Uncharacterized protein n=1 Tax=Polyplax serrata TaxID=468196 RepID=A0AAN8PNE1_POLSC